MFCLAHINKVLRSINDDGADRCVDIFKRPDGSFGFEEYRRDHEDQRGWFPIGGHATKIYTTQVSAFEAALCGVTWLRRRVERK